MNSKHCCQISETYRKHTTDRQQAVGFFVGERDESSRRESFSEQSQDVIFVGHQIRYAIFDIEFV